MCARDEHALCVPRSWHHHALTGATDRTRRISRSPPCNGAGMGVRAHLQAIEGDEVDLDAEAWARPRMPGPLRGVFGKLPYASRESPRLPDAPRAGTLCA